MPQSAAVRAAHEDDLPLLRREGNPRSHDFNSATLAGRAVPGVPVTSDTSIDTALEPVKFFEWIGNGSRDVSSAVSHA
jgi:hypothetical protein